MTPFKVFKTVLTNFISNFRSMFKYNNEQDCIRVIQTQNQILSNHIFSIRKEIIELYFDTHKNEAIQYQDELVYLKKLKKMTPFLYPQIKQIEAPISGFDKKKGLPFVIHKQKLLYFPEKWSPESACKAYSNYIERENLLGGGYTLKAPHQYITDTFYVEQNDIVIDAGCAEALFALDSIEKAKHVYLLEPDPLWSKPLQATFAPYKEKVTIIPKFLSSEKQKNTTTLNSLFDTICNESFFIKMDIEGAEESIIQASTKFFTSQNKIKLACCTYHKAQHAETISMLLTKLGYNLEFSNGFMLFPWDNNQQPPYFRKGLIRAKKII